MDICFADAGNLVTFVYPKSGSMKNTCGFLFALFLLNTGLVAQTPSLDSTAILILNRMSDVLTELKSCRLAVSATYDIYHPALGLIKHADNADVILKGPDKFLVSLSGDKGARTFLFNGKTLSYYSFDNNHYAEFESPGSILDLADTVSRAFGIDFFVVDFFCPWFVEELTLNSSALSYLGLTPVDGIYCFHLAGVLSGFTYQIWIQKDPYFLPVKTVLVYTSREGTPQYEARFTHWTANQEIPDAIFGFTPPPGAVKTLFRPVLKQR
jgi:hypothetical protein